MLYSSIKSQFVPIACLVRAGRLRAVFFQKADILPFTIPGRPEQVVISRHELFLRGRLMSADFFVATNDVTHKTVAFVQIFHNGIFVVGMWFIVSAGDIDARELQPFLFQCIYIRSHTRCYPVTIFLRIDGGEELFGTKLQTAIRAIRSLSPLRSHWRTNRQSVKKSISAALLPTQPVSSWTKNAHFMTLNSSRHFRQIQIPFLSSAPIPVIRFCRRS